MNLGEFLTDIVPWLTIMIAIVATVFIFSGIDDLLMDILYLVWRGYKKLVFQRKHKVLTREDLLALDQKRIAIMIPTWREAPVIRQTLDNAVKAISYDNYRIYVGVYPNDPETQQEVRAAQALHADRIVLVELDHDGPTTKADCLNTVIDHIYAEDVERGGEQTAMFVLDDAEDIIPRYGLRIFNYLVPRKDFVQLPVFPIKVPWWQFTAGHYMDEFAQLHVKDMRPREWLTGAIPSAGVGAAFSRKAMDLARKSNEGKAFAENTLTEDYELPLHLQRMRVREAFYEPGVPVRDREAEERHEYPLEEEYPYIRSGFPATLKAAVRQKSRWVLGISLQGWQHLGWSPNMLQSYMLWRDRKVLIGNLANFLGYVLVLLTLGVWLVRWGLLGDTTFPNVIPPGSLVEKMLLVTVLIMFVQLIVRSVCTYAVYGAWQAVLSVPRAIWGNVINFFATTRAMALFFRSKRRGGEPIPWEKTEHEANANH